MLEPHSLMMDLESELFNYTAGRFLYASCIFANDAHHFRERTRVFNIPGLFNTIAKAMNCGTEQIVDFRKLAEGGFNRIFLITLDTDFQLVARILYPLLVPKAYAVASEVATMDFLRSKGLPIPKAKTEYILMEYVKGTNLSQIWSDLEEDEIISLMDQLAKVESSMMSISFPAGGSIYYARDLKELSGNEGIPLHNQVESIAFEKERFCIGPIEQLKIKSVLFAGAEKDLAYLNQFGAPRVPYECFRMEHYNNEKQLPSDHIENLGRYLRLAPSLVPDDDSLSAFCIRHPDLTDSNLRVSTDSGCLQMLSVLDWQHAAVLPLFLHAGMPKFIQNEDDEVSKDDQDREGELLRRRLVHYHYNLSTATHNRIHHKGLGYFATDGATCPVVFTEIAAAEELWQALANAKRGERWLRDFVAYGEETWVPAAHYEAAKAIGQEVKRRTFKACAEDEEMTKETYAVIEANSPLDDMNEDELEEYK
ncbi:kinase-like domain-containing protein [Lentinula detonsa]|uniref:Kinase-like domain-containing protein n=1 Tax=Lentinula detonsa TaxID=2804962 RepID=A0A9W8TT62_9AGAR|nr:kinase-like domain-containing protein [Lentinula detonsa]